MLYEVITNGMQAMGLGTLVLMLFMVIYYRKFGLA